MIHEKTIKRYWVGCDGCNRATPAFRTVFLVEKWAKGMGWVRQQVKGSAFDRLHYCPECAKTVEGAIHPF